MSLNIEGVELAVLETIFRIDFLSLDIEGVELAVLETIPWSKVDIETLLIEVKHCERRNGVFLINVYFQNPISLQPDDINL